MFKIFLFLLLGFLFSPAASASVFNAADRSVSSGKITTAVSSTLLSAPSSTRWLTGLYYENTTRTQVYCGGTEIFVSSAAARGMEYLQYECSQAIYVNTTGTPESLVVLTYTDTVPYDVSGGGGGGGLAAGDLDPIIYGIGILTFLGSAGLMLKGFV